MMKTKILPLFLVMASGLTVLAQAEIPNDFAGKNMLIHHIDGTTTQIDASTIDYIDFAESEPQEPAAPKVGDYYYSDGTWSDGGLISIGANGTDQVWSDVKPGPLAGKTVIGIVCSVDPDRIAAADKDAGYTHGYVLACKNAFNPDRLLAGAPTTTVQWILDPSYEATQVAKACKSWYENLDGRANTQVALDLYGTEAAAKAPAFYYSSTGFGVEAPAGTSGWFLPSTGQLWDAIANFCGNDVATMMVDWQTVSYAVDYGYQDVNPAGENPIDLFNSIYSLVPDESKDVLVPDNDRRGYAMVWTSVRYNSESGNEFNIGKASVSATAKNLVEPYPEWYDGDAYARPMLAF